MLCGLVSLALGPQLLEVSQLAGCKLFRRRKASKPRLSGCKDLGFEIYGHNGFGFEELLSSM